MRGLEARAIRVVEIETPTPRPFARSLLFGYVAAFLYEGDRPLAERKAQALALDVDAAVASCSAAPSCASCSTPTSSSRRARAAAARRRPPAARASRAWPTCSDCSVRCRSTSSRRGSTSREVPATSAQAARARLAELGECAADRAIEASWGGEQLVAGIEDAAGCATRSACRCRSACRSAFVEPVADPLGDLVGRYARTHAPFTAAAAALAARPGHRGRRRHAAPARATSAGSSRASSARAARAPSGATPRCCGGSAAARSPRCGNEVEPVEQAALARFLPEWQHVGHEGAPRRGRRAHGRRAAGRRARCRPRRWESLILPARVLDYRPALLDELTATGEVVWSRHRAGSPATTAGSRCTSPTPLPLTLPAARGGRPHRRSSRRCSPRSAAAARSSSGSSRTRSARPTTACSRPRCGTWCGTASSPTTRSRRCGR